MLSQKSLRQSFSLIFQQQILLINYGIVLPAKSDSDAMFCLQSYQDLESIDHLCINPILWIGLIHNWSIDSR